MKNRKLFIVGLCILVMSTGLVACKKEDENPEVIESEEVGELKEVNIDEVDKRLGLDKKELLKVNASMEERELDLNGEKVVQLVENIKFYGYNDVKVGHLINEEDEVAFIEIEIEDGELDLDKLKEDLEKDLGEALQDEKSEEDRTIQWMDEENLYHELTLQDGKVSIKLFYIVM